MMRRSSRSWVRCVLFVACALGLLNAAASQEAPVRKQMVRDGQSAQDAAAHMAVPEGFHVSVVASEPEIHQPIAFTFDERGRIWVVEGFTYPRRQPEGQGKDRVIILEDANQDGAFERRTVFVEGLNLVSGIEVGFGGVWIGAAPYLLFIPDADRDDHPDGPPEILLDGWGYQDTHETLNAFRWGPDGWLYGCQGVFTHSRVGAPGTPDKDRVPLNACVWRYHPTERDFEVFAHGTSNPWGIDFDDDGQAFITACVIPHLYHVIQGGRYQRQSGQHFNPHTYADITTIADHLHHGGKRWTPEHAEASDAFGGGHAHCGALVYLGDNFPKAYRGRIFMNNLHGRRINVDSLERRGSGFVGHHEPDLVKAYDEWFLGVTVESGPDGSLFFSDWYDQQTCHNNNPQAWDRSNGRIYNLRYGDPQRPRVDLSQLSNAELVDMQLRENDWYVRQARRLLQERGPDPATHAALAKILLNHDDPRRRLRALWALHVTDGLNEERTLALLDHGSEYERAWAVQLSLERGKPSETLLARLARLAREDASPAVRLYLASALQRLPYEGRWEIASALGAHEEDSDDHNLPLVLWYGVEPLVTRFPDRALALAAKVRIPLLERFMIRRAAANTEALEPLMAALREGNVATRKLILGEMVEAFASHANLRQPDGWNDAYETLLEAGDSEITEKVRTIAVKFGDRRVFPLLRQLAADESEPLSRRRHALGVILDGKDPDAATLLHALVEEKELRAEAIRGLAAYDHRDTPAVLLGRYETFDASERAATVGALCARPLYARALIAAVGHGIVPRTDLHAFHIRQLRALGNAEIERWVTEEWGSVRKSSAERLELIARHRQALTPDVLAAADPSAGRAVFSSKCEQCHMLFGTGGQIGPDLTGSNRRDVGYVLENLLDPSALVGKDYQLHVFITSSGRVVSGLIAAETNSAVTVQTQEEKVLLPRGEILKHELSTDSMMPEGLLEDLGPREIRDLVAYLGSPVQVLAKGAPVAVDPETHRVPDVLEGEKLSRAGKVRGSARPQAMSGFGRDLWSDNHQLWWTGARPDDVLRLAFEVPTSGLQRIEAALTRAPDYGVVQFLVDNVEVGVPVDCYHQRVVPTGPLVLAEIDLTEGRHELAVRILGANPAAIKAYMVGIDYLRLVPALGSPTEITPSSPESAAGGN